MGEEEQKPVRRWETGTAVGIHSHATPCHLGSKNTHTQLSLWMGTGRSADTALTTQWYSGLSRVFPYRASGKGIQGALKMCAIHQEGWRAHGRDGTDSRAPQWVVTDLQSYVPIHQQPWQGIWRRERKEKTFSHQVLLVEEELLRVFVTTTSLGDPFSLEFLVQLGEDTKHLIQDS